MKKINIYRVLRIVLIIAALVVLAFVIKKFYGEGKTENLAKEVLQEIKATTETTEITGEVTQTIDAELGGYKVVGIIKIPKIDIEYPILEKTNVESLNISITKFWGNDINEIGNVTLVLGDIIELTDIQNITLKYEVFHTEIIDPNDISCILPIEEGRREVTLITCENGKANRFIVKAKEVK